MNHKTKTPYEMHASRWLLLTGFAFALLAGCGDRSGVKENSAPPAVESAAAPAPGVSYGKNGKECPKICTGEGGVSVNMCKSLALAQGCLMPESAPVVKASVTLAKPDPSIKPASFASQAIKSRRDLAELFYAVSGQSVDIGKEAAAASSIASQSDVFKKKELTDQLASQINAGVQRVAANPLLRYRVILASASLGPYDLAKNGFPIMSIAPGSKFAFLGGFELSDAAADYSLMLSNAADFAFLKVDDEAAARKIEQLRSSAGLTTAALRVYVFVQGADAAKAPGQVIGQALQVDLVSAKGEVLASTTR